MHLSSPQGPPEVLHYYVGHIAGDHLQTAGPGYAGHVQKKKRETMAENKLIQMYLIYSASYLLVKDNGKSRCSLTTSKAARST